MTGVFNELAYNCIILLRQYDPDCDSYENSSKVMTPRIGIRRVRAMELLKTLFIALAKNFNLKDDKVLSEFLRRKVIDTMFHMIRTYPYCSISH